MFTDNPVYGSLVRNDLLADTPKLIKQFDDKFNVKWSQDAAGKWTVTSDRD